MIVFPDSSKARKDQSWQSSLKVIIRDKPMLSVIVLIAVMVIITAIVIVAFVSASGKPKYKRNYGDGDDDRANVPPDTGIGISESIQTSRAHRLSNFCNTIYTATLLICQRKHYTYSI